METNDEFESCFCQFLYTQQTEAETDEKWTMADPLLTALDTGGRFSK